MQKADIKKKILESQKSSDSRAFTESTLNYLPLVESKKELDEFVNYFSNRAVFELLESGAIDSVKRMIADKIFEVILLKNDIVTINYIDLYLFYKEHGSVDEKRVDKYIDYIDGIDSSSLGDIEKCYVYNMRFVLRMFRGDDGIVEELLSGCSTLHMHKTEPVDQANSIKDFLQKCEVPVETVFRVLKKRLEVEEYLKLDFHQRRSIFNWSLHVFWNVPRYYGSRLWGEMYESLKSILYAHLDRKEIDEAMYLHFFIYHKMGNIFQTQEEWARFNEEISKVATKHYQQFAKEKSLRAPSQDRKKKGKKKIGILKDRLVENSPFKVEYSLLKALMEDEEFKERYEIKIYNMSYFEKSANDPKCERKLQSLGIDIFDAMLPFYKEGFYHSHLSKAIFLREMILNDEVDILISAVGAYDICDFLLSTRCAPKQIYWSHGNHEYDIEGIDERICHFAPENHKYEFKQLTIPMDEEYLNPPVPKEKIEAEREKYPKDAFILGTIGRLVKVDSDEYLETVAKIMEQNPNTIYIAAGSGDSEGIRKKVERLGISERFYMPGFVDAHLYGHIIDLWLDTFPLSQGASRIEYIAKEKAFVSMISPPFGIEYLDKFMIQAKESDYMILSFVGEYSNSCVNGIKKVFDLCREKKVLFVINNKELFDNLANAFPEYLDKFEYLNIENKTLRQYADICFSTINDIFLVKSTNFIRKKHISCLNFDFVRRTDTSSIIIDNSDIFLYDDEYLHLFSKCFNTKEFFDTSDRLINDDNIRKKIINSQTFFNIKHSELVVKESVRFFTSL